MTAPLLVADGLIKHFVVKYSAFGRPLSSLRAVDGVSFELNSGETLALVGESGCGKSTVGRLVLRLIEPTAGRVTFAGRDITSLPPTEVRRFRSQA
jgi:peptide/nickel transport system ATP-binding protein